LRAFQAGVIAWADTREYVFRGAIEDKGGEVGEEGGREGGRGRCGGFGDVVGGGGGGRGVIHANYCFFQHFLVARIGVV